MKQLFWSVTNFRILPPEFICKAGQSLSSGASDPVSCIKKVGFRILFWLTWKFWFLAYPILIDKFEEWAWHQHGASCAGTGWDTGCTGTWTGTWPTGTWSGFWLGFCTFGLTGLGVLGASIFNINLSYLKWAKPLPLRIHTLDILFLWGYKCLPQQLSL